MEGMSVSVPLNVHSTTQLQDEEGSEEHISAEAIKSFLGVSASWLSKAKKILDILDKVGPDSPNPDPLVVKRLQVTKVVRKGHDLQSFLKVHHPEFFSKRP